MIFAGAISSAAKKQLREWIRAILHPRWSEQTVEWFAEKRNAKIRGWINYYSRFYHHKTLKVFQYVNEKLKAWIKTSTSFKAKGK
jgi:RNA-directed DNA polymerase